MPIDEIFNPFEHLLEVTILGRRVRMPEKNSILRGLQYVNMDGISSSDLCWNGDCLNCRVKLRNGNGTKTVIACRTEVSQGMEIVDLAPAIDIFKNSRND
jgi:predicted molibdopterin-dependent oxidoreductase YjgC